MNAIVCWVIGVNALSAFASGPPSPQAVSAIDQHIQSGVAKDKAALDAEIDFDALSRRPGIAEADIVRERKRIDALRAERDHEWLMAMHLAIQAYGIAKLPLEGTLTDKRFSGRRVPWLVQAGAREDRTTLDAQGNRIVIRAAPRDWAAVTDVDGTTTIFFDFFVHQDANGVKTPISAGELGLMLLHERVHFKQATSPKTGVTRAQRDIEAYSTQLKNLAVFGLRDSTPYDQFLRGKIRHYQRVEQGLEPDSDAQFYTDLRSGFYSPEELEKIRSQTLEVREKVAHELDGLDPNRHIQQGELGYLQTWQGEAMPAFVALERDRRAQEEDAATERRAEEDFRTVKRWALGCEMPWTGPDKWEFSNGAYHFRFRTETWDQFRAAFMLAGACMFPEDTAPCLDAVDVLERQWADAAFKDSLLLAAGSSNVASECVYFYMDHYRPGHGFKSIRKVAQDYRDGVRAAARMAEEQARHGPSANSDERPRNTSPSRPPGNDIDREWDPVLGIWIRRAR